MEAQRAIRPPRLWQSLLFALVPGLYAVVAQYVILPPVVRLGICEENAYNTVHFVFAGLFLATVLALRMEGRAPNWASSRTDSASCSVSCLC